MSLASISMKNALHLWSELEAAYFGINKYGGNVAEIYAYRLIPNHPSYGANKELDAELDLERASALHSILTEFNKHRGCLIKINDRTLGNWLITEEFGHRAHISVQPDPENYDLKRLTNAKKRTVASEEANK